MKMTKNNTLHLPGQKQAIEDRNRPALDVGEYLGVITQVAEHVKEETGSISLKWSILVNSNQDWEFEGWDADATKFDLTYYTWIGYLKGGELHHSDKAFSLTEALQSVDAFNHETETLDLDGVKGTLVRVTINHEPGFNAPDRLFAGVARLKPYYAEDGTFAPKIEVEVPEDGEVAF